MFNFNVAGSRAFRSFAFIGAILLQIVRFAALAFFAIVIFRAFGAAFSPGEASYGIVASSQTSGNRLEITRLFSHGPMEFPLTEKKGCKNTQKNVSKT